jgi:hypothetical protein
MHQHDDECHSRDLPPAAADPANAGRFEAYRNDGLSIVNKLR